MSCSSVKFTIVLWLMTDRSNLHCQSLRQYSDLHQTSAIDLEGSSLSESIVVIVQYVDLVFVVSLCASPGDEESGSN